MKSEYQSPTYKLASFFESSRDKWRDRSKDSTYEIKKLKQNLQYSKTSNSNLKDEVTALKEDNVAMAKKIQELECALEKEQKKT